MYRRSTCRRAASSSSSCPTESEVEEQRWQTMWWGGTVLHSLRRATALAKLFGGHCGREANGGVVGAARWPHHWFVGPRVHSLF